jgi:hypothetical protein
MKTRNIIVMVFMLISTMTFSQSAGRQRKADKATREWRYEIECAGIGKDGTYLIKVWSYSKNPKVATTQAKKNAIHGVIFKGFSGGGQGCTSQRPLAPSPGIEEEKADFFDPFFEEGGKFMKYVSESADGNVDASDRVKVGKEYKIGVLVSVSKDALRKDLEAAGIIKGLTSGF